MTITTIRDAIEAAAKACETAFEQARTDFPMQGPGMLLAVMRDLPNAIRQIAIEPAPVGEEWRDGFEHLARNMAKDGDRPIVCVVHPNGDWSVYNAQISADLLAAAPQPPATVEVEVERLRAALDAAHYYIDASDRELVDAGITREDALSRARDLRAALSPGGAAR